MFGRLFRLSAVAFAASVACGDDSSSQSSEPVAPPVFDLLSVEPVSEFPACDRVDLIARVAIEGWELLPPGACGAEDECGHFALHARGPNSVLTVRSATQTTLVTLRPRADWVGTVTFEAELLRDDGSPFQTPEGSGVTDTLTLEIASDCIPSSGAGGAGGGPADGGAGGSMEAPGAGAGGAGPEGGAGGEASGGEPTVGGAAGAAGAAPEAGAGGMGAAGLGAGGAEGGAGAGAGGVGGDGGAAP